VGVITNSKRVASTWKQKRRIEPAGKFGSPFTKGKLLTITIAKGDTVMTYPTVISCIAGSMEIHGPATTLLETVCCVCKKHIQFKDGEGSWGPSHTYCDDCLKVVIAEVKTTSFRSA